MTVCVCVCVCVRERERERERERWGGRGGGRVGVVGGEVVTFVKLSILLVLCCTVHCEVLYDS